MVQKKIPFKAAKLEAEKEIEGSVPQQGKSYANAAAAATGMQTQTPNLSAPNKTKSQKQSQTGTELPGAIRAEALAAAIDLRETLRSKRNSSNAKPTAPGSNGAQQTPKSKKNRGRTNKAQAKPGNNTAPAPQAAVDKQAPKPANQPAPKAGHSSATDSAPQVAVAKQASKPNRRPASKAGHHNDPRPAPQAPGSQQVSPSPKQAPVPSTSKAKPGDNPASAPQAAAMERAEATALPPSDDESEMEVTPAPASQVAEVVQNPQPVTDQNSKSPASSPNSLKNGFSFANAAQKGAKAKQTNKEPHKPKDGYNFEFKLARQTAKGKSRSDKTSSRGQETNFLSENRYSALDWSGFEDPEEMDENASFPY